VRYGTHFLALVLFVSLIPSAAVYAQTASELSAAATPPSSAGTVAAEGSSVSEEPNIAPLPDPLASLPALLPQPQGNATLMGGTIRKLDMVRDQITLQAFGGSSTRILFDDRTHFYRDGTVGSARDLANGQRVYVDTVLAGTQIFARNIRVVSNSQVGTSNGRVLNYDARAGELTMRDALSPEPVRLRVSPNATFVRKDRSAGPSELVPGTLVALTFGPDGGGRDVVRQVTILAEPGSAFRFDGRIMYLDVHRGLLVVQDPRDQKTYDIHFDPAKLRMSDDLREGMDISVMTSYDGNEYIANAVTISPASEK
jgi:hypothetical protein